jgi:hypothetical protein
LTSKFLEVQEDIPGTRRSDINQNFRTLKIKHFILDSLERKLRFPVPLHGILLGQSISSPPSCREENDRCMA